MVEQWPFKPFVTGSNPVRPIKDMFKRIFFIIYFIPLFSLSETVIIKDEFDNKLNATYLKSEKSKTIVMILHGTRGHKKLELIDSLTERFSDHNIDALSMNLSYGISNRNDDFLPCDITHTHLNSKSLSELRLWFNFILEKNRYDEIILLGHSRGGLNITQFYSTLSNENRKKINSIILLAPITDDFSNTIKKIKQNNIIKNIKDNKINDEEIIKIDFMSCPDVNVKYQTFKDYIYITKDGTGSKGSLLGLLNQLFIETLVITASNDIITPKTHQRVESINSKKVSIIQIEDADHFFRDLYFDDMFDAILEFIQ